MCLITLFTLFLARCKALCTDKGRFEIDWSESSFASSLSKSLSSLSGNADKILVRISVASRYSTVSSFSRNVCRKSSSASSTLNLSEGESQSQKAVMLSQFSISAVREKLQLPSKATLFVASANSPHFV